MGNKRIILILSIIIALIVIFTLVVLLTYSRSGTLSAQESALKQTNQLLSIMIENPSEPIPDDLPGHLRGKSCWDLFQLEMAQNSNEFTLEVKKDFDSRNDPLAVHDMVEVWIDVVFPDGDQIEVYYSQGGLTGCKSIK